MDISDDSNKNFFKHVFNFDDDSKSDIFNILQYAILAIIPVVILNKTIGKYVPEADDKKGSLELSAEVIIQVIVTFIGLLLIHRMITFVPTYSNTKYADFNIMYIILAILMITMSLQTKMGEKVSILSERVSELCNGPSDKNKKGKNGSVKVSQPISGQQILQPMPPTYTDGTAISALPSTDTQPSSDLSQQMPNYNNMYRQDTTPLVGAASPGMTEGFNGPVAASEFLGGSSFSSW
jgi:hypothetical protein